MYEKSEISRPSGINKDLNPYELPPDIWSDGANVFFRRDRTEAGVGYENPFTLTDTIGSPLAMAYFINNSGVFWYYGSESDIYRTDGTSTASIGSGYSATREDNWSTTNFNGVLIFNNVNDVPQQSDPALSHNSMKDLDNWDAPSPWGLASRCEVMRGYKNYLFALNCYDESGTEYPQMVRWSSPAVAGDVPPSWDPVDVAEQAGLYNLSDTPGPIVDAQVLGDYLVVYKTDAVWLIQFIGGDGVFSFRKLFNEAGGCLAKDCVAEFDGKHFVLSDSGAYVHNGSTKSEVMEPWVKDEFFKFVAKDRKREARVVADHKNQEMWIYFTTTDSPTGWCDKALIWNWETNKWTIKRLDGISYVAQGVIPVDTPGVETWDSDPNSWDSDTTIWNSDPEIDPTEIGLLLGDPINDLLYKSEFQRNGVGIAGTSFVKRIGLDMGDDMAFKYVTRIIPHVIGANEITIRLFAEDFQSGNPTLIETLTFDPTQDQYVDCHVVGRYVGIEFSGDGLWTLTGYSAVWEKAGEF